MTQIWCEKELEGEGKRKEKERKKEKVSTGVACEARTRALLSPRREHKAFVVFVVVVVFV